MTQLTYNDAWNEILEETELGYTLASQDKLWTCFVFDDWSDDEMRGNRLFFTNGDGAMSYDVWDEELFWTSRAEAEEFQKLHQDRFDQRKTDADPQVTVWLINWGDDSCWENGILTKREGITEGKFAGSGPALVEMTARWDALH